MADLAAQVIQILQGKTLCVAESCTGGGIGAALTAVSGSSSVFLGGIISYTDQVKSKLLNVPSELLKEEGAVSAAVAEAMASGAKSAVNADIAVSVTGLAGPGGDEYGNPVGTVFIGYCDDFICMSRKFLFSGNRDAVRNQAVTAALELIIEFQSN